MFEFSVSKDMKKKGYNKGGDNREGRGTFILTLVVKELKISVEQGLGGNNTKYNRTLNTLFSVLIGSSSDHNMI